MAKRKNTDPVTEREVAEVVKQALLTAFGDRHLDIEVARRGFQHAGFDLIQMHLREVAERSKR